MFSWLARLIESWPFVHRIALFFWKNLPPSFAGFLRGLLTKNWVVGAVAVIINKSEDPSQVLLVRHTYRKKGKWGLPGGALESPPISPREHQDDQDTQNVLQRALHRELLQELGMGITVGDLLHIQAIPNIEEEPGPYHLIFYFKCVPGDGVNSLIEGLKEGRIVPRSPEIDLVRFVPINILQTYDLASAHEKFLIGSIHGL